jgi:S-adenosylmethionine:tRNA ribosyltransferase-isomerase
LLLSEFDYELPENLIATVPVFPRESAKLLCISSVGKLTERTIADLPELLNPEDILIFNDTKVIPARLTGRKGDAKIEVNLIRQLNESSWKALAKPAKKLEPQAIISFSGLVTARVKNKLDRGEIELEFSVGGSELEKFLYSYGEIPLPPYILKKRKAGNEDIRNYQTIYAKNHGAVAAPTAGLHFTEEMFIRLRNKGIKFAYITLHVGAGTFLPVVSENIADHKMHEEWFSISAEAAKQINETRSKNGRVVAVGTTSLRALESVYKNFGELKEYEGLTDIFITPGYEIRSSDLLLTNFHLPKSTLLMLVSAFSTKENINAAYQYAIKNNFRFFSYGDACLIEK